MRVTRQPYSPMDSDELIAAIRARALIRRAALTGGRTSFPAPSVRGTSPVSPSWRPAWCVHCGTFSVVT